ncbi:hypothetical protein [Rosenbergiella nectarea]|uniref:hypothetical protein n=1 Tax=Rosenbergiella nectarea TaxID=988801 RepID=UPI001F4DC5AC|nr:hypothetical protein [Rosenbergiella nectarea]
MVALTQEKREELVSRLKIYIRTTETAIKAGLATEEDLFNLEVRKVALASLTAAPSGYRWFHDGSPETRGWYASCYPLDSDYLERCLVDKSIHSHEPLFTAPPVPEINKDDYIGLQVSVDVSTCDADPGHRYFGRVSTITESKGEVVLVVEEPEKNFTAPPLPEIKGYAEPHTQYSEGLVDGYNRCLADINRLSGLGKWYAYL